MQYPDMIVYLTDVEGEFSGLERTTENGSGQSSLSITAEETTMEPHGEFCWSPT